MATKSLTFDIYGRDKTASKTIRKVGDEVDDAGSRFKHFGKIAAAGLAVVAAGAIKFGADSVKAYAEAEQAQNRLNFAYKQFPAIADVSLDSLRALNEELAKKTRYDDDAYAMGQAQLAQYGLTGQQIMQLTPLLADYAGKTGKDLPAAAEDLGKALLGQGRALKEVGIDFTDAGSVAANFDQIVAGLRSQVGGFAESDATTAAGKLDILNNRFGEIQESVGEELMPVLEGAMDWLETDGMVIIEDATSAFGDLAAAIDELADTEGLKWLNEQLGKGGSLDLVGGGAFKDGEGVLGGPSIMDWITNFPKSWERMFGETKRVTDEGMSGVRYGMGGGFSLMAMDMDVFRAATGEKVGGAWTDANGVTQTGLGAVAGSAGAGLSSVLGRILGFVPAPGAQMANAWLQANSQTVSGWGGIVSTTGAGVGRVGAKVGEVPGVVRSPFANAGSWLFSAGENIVTGLINGIRGMIGSAAQTAAKLAAATVAAAKSALGIQSPSKVFREIGEFVGAGYGLGIQDSVRSAQLSVMDMVAPPVTVTAQHAITSSGSTGDRPIYMDGSLFGVLREVANGEAQIVLNTQKVAIENGSRR